MTLHKSYLAGLVISGLCSVLLGQTVSIDAGGPGDTGYSANTSIYTIPVSQQSSITGTTDFTLRYGQSITYTITVPIAGIYVIMLSFMEPGYSTVGQRVFSVTGNDQPLLQNIDVFAEAGLLVPLVKSSLLYIQSKLILTLNNPTPGHNAIISSILVSNLNVGGGTQNCCIPSSLKWQVDVFPTVPAPTIPPAGGAIPTNPTFPLTYLPTGPILIFRNGLLQISPLDYTLTGVTLSFIIPMQIGDNVVAAYQYTLPSSPVVWCVAGPQCAGLGLATLFAQNGSPSTYFLLPTPPSFIASPAQWQ